MTPYCEREQVKFAGVNTTVSALNTPAYRHRAVTRFNRYADTPRQYTRR